jgi:enediyne biosynthesis protein E4
MITTNISIHWKVIVLLFFVFVGGCSSREHKVHKDTLFILLAPEQSGVQFVNRITPDDRINILTYEYLYNGAGVGIGDFNNDGFQDIFFAGSQVPPKLYMNKGKVSTGQGGFAFEDVTEGTGITGDENWAFGVSVVDINQDGFQDIYISMGGPGNMNNFPNKLFVHQGLDPTGKPMFKEMADVYGLADRGHSIQALFFDYDRDGDLDMYLLTGGGFERSPNNPSPIVKDGTAVNTDRLYRNDYSANAGHPIFTNVSREAGILQEGYGLGVSLADINDDGWPDIYVTNDYLTNDQLYVNNGDGTFSEKVGEYFKHTSHFAMGNDIGDINNDGLMDVITVDMLPDDYSRRKLMFGATQYNKFYYAVNNGYSYQYMRNTLQLNNGNGSFSEIGQLAGIYKTDWSWSVLLADLDNDEYQDVFITNGFGKDVTDLDFVKFRSSVTSEIKNEALRRKVLLDSLAQRPGIKVSNYAFRNTGSTLFENVSRDWGFNTPTYSNGAAYADFDNDGDLDLVISNLDEPAQVYRNTSQERESPSNYLRIKLTASGQNKTGIGSKVIIRYGKKLQSKLKSPVHGFQSTMEDVLHFGLGSTKQIDTLEVHWPDGRMSLIKHVNANALIEVNDSTAVQGVLERPRAPTIFVRSEPKVVSYRHVENPFIDFNHEPLLPHKLSQEGPGIAVADVNGDGLEDFFVGGALLTSGKIFIQKKNGTFAGYELSETDKESEDMGCLFFDADGDSDPDLYVVSGGNEYNPDHRFYQDRLYFNDGKGNFNKDESALPKIGASGSCVVAADYDHDGDLDLFVGGRALPTAYPKSPRSYLLINNGQGKFEDGTAHVAPELQRPGMVTTALWTDFDHDRWTDLIVAGEYMPISFYKNEGGERLVQVRNTGLEDSQGWWNSLTAGDFDNDNDIDYVAGNFGLNTHFHASAEEPISVVFSDFDNNGALEAITSYYDDGVNYPMPSLDVLTSQLPVLKRKILYHRTYANTSTKRLLEVAGNARSESLYCKTLQSGYVENQGNGKFAFKPFPVVMQTAPVYGMITEDVDADGNLDFIAVGNSYSPEVVGGRCDAFIGQVMLGDGKGAFKPMPVTQSGFFADGDAKSISKILVGGSVLCMVTQNNDSLKVFKKVSKQKTPVITLKKSEAGAVLTLTTGQMRRVEIGYGTSYLSQSSRTLNITADIAKVEFFDQSGRPTRTAVYRDGQLQITSGFKTVANP